MVAQRPPTPLRRVAPKRLRLHLGRPPATPARPLRLVRISRPSPLTPLCHVRYRRWCYLSQPVDTRCDNSPPSALLCPAPVGSVYICVAQAAPDNTVRDGASAALLDQSLLRDLAAARAWRLFLEAWLYALLIWLLVGGITTEIAFGSISRGYNYAMS